MELDDFVTDFSSAVNSLPFSGPTSGPTSGFFKIKILLSGRFRFRFKGKDDVTKSPKNVQ